MSWGLIKAAIIDGIKFFPFALSAEAARRVAEVLFDLAAKAGMTIWDFLRGNPDAVDKAVQTVAAKAIETGKLLIYIQ